MLYPLSYEGNAQAIVPRSPTGGGHRRVPCTIPTRRPLVSVNSAGRNGQKTDRNFLRPRVALKERFGLGPAIGIWIVAVVVLVLSA